MPKLATSLVPVNINRYKPKTHAYTVADGNGLYLLVLPSGKKSWQIRYKTMEGKGRRVVIGNYPEISLADARTRSTEIHLNAHSDHLIVGVRVGKRLAKEKRTLEQVKEEQLAAEVKTRSFTILSEEWLTHYKPTVTLSTYNKIKGLIHNHLQPAIGHIDIATLDRFAIAPIIESMNQEAGSLARRIPHVVNAIIDMAIEKQLRPEYTKLDLHAATKKLPKSGRRPAITREGELGKLIRAIRGYDNIVISRALQLCAWTVHRPGIVASARWSELDLDRAIWAVPAFEPGSFKGDGTPINRMKMGVEHLVSLPKQAAAMLREQWKITGTSEYVFSAQQKQKTEHLTEDALSKALRSLGFLGKHSPHGFRATFRTMAREVLGADSDELEAQLAHVKKTQNGDSYDRTTFTKQRIKIMQDWADYLDNVAQGGKVIALTTHAANAG